MDFYHHPETGAQGMIELDPDEEGSVVIVLILSCGQQIRLQEDEVSTILISTDGSEPAAPY